jgi:molybdopterin molybdotransferase
MCDRYLAQLSDDSFAFGGPLMTVAEMQALIREQIIPVTGTEPIALKAARGRVLASDIRAPIDLPPFDNSAVDGFAVRHADLAAEGETRLPVMGRLQAGSGAVDTLRRGTAVRIFTGAPMPEGADTVFMQEDCRADGDTVILPAGLKAGANRRKAGEDIAKGQVLLAKGTRLSAQHIGLAAAAGLTTVEVRRPIRVAIFSTGDEVLEPGEPLKPAAIYDANRALLIEMATALGADVTDLGILRDDEASLASALSAAADDHDVVVTSGGVSTGEADYVKSAVERVGKLVFWRVAIKPGRPVALAVLKGTSAGHEAAFTGLPGNPVAAFVTFAKVVRPIILQLAGAREEDVLTFPVRATFAYRKKAGRREFVRVSLRRGGDGMLEAVKYTQDGAGVITSLTKTDGLLELPEELTVLEPGMVAGFSSYAQFMGQV